jgi:apolipoprotein N-acyltransferase
MATAFATFYICLLAYGLLRLNIVPRAPHSVLVGLVETHAGADIFPPDAPSTMTLMQGYARQIKSLAGQEQHSWFYLK